jgi:hypothetical protein
MIENMTQHCTVLERAFALARTGEYAGPGEIRTQLKAEGYSTSQLEGPSLFKQLRALCLAARTTTPS